MSPGSGAGATVACLALASATVFAAGCSRGDRDAERVDGAAPRRTPTTAADAPGASAPPVAAPERPAAVVGTRVRFASADASVVATITADTPATRDFLSLLPLDLKLEDLRGKEKIGYLPRKLRTRTTPGFDPEDGDLIYFRPWGNLGFYYDAGGIEYSDETLRIGTYDASPVELAAFDGVTVRVTAEA